MSNKIKVLSEKNIVNDKSSIYNTTGIKGTEVIIKDPVTGKEHFRGRNSVIVPGSLFTAKAHFPRMTMPVVLPSYNEALDLDPDGTGVSVRPDNQPEQIWLFCVGTDGAGPEGSQVKDVDLTQWLGPLDIVPFRCVQSDISREDRDIYFGKKTSGSNIYYYFKTFSADPVCYPTYADGTAINERMYDTQNKDPEVRVELEFKITKEECREYFALTSENGVNDARVNTLSLLSAWYTTDSNGIKWFQNIQPVTKINFATESLADETKGLDIIYNIYY